MTENLFARTPRLKVAVGQIEAAPYEIDRNIEKHFELIGQAREQDVDLLVFPELSICGYPVGLRAPEIAIPRNHPRLLELAEASGAMRTIVGFIEDGYAAQLHNACAVLQNGSVKFIHRKLNLASYGNLDEKKHYASGRYVETFALEEPWVGSILVCADMWNPALVHIAALYGATLLISPVASSINALSGGFSNPRGWESVMHFYSMIYGMPAIMANFVGSHKPDDKFWGGSRIIDPYGNIVVRAGDEEELIVADLDYNHIRDARYRLPTVRDSNLDLIRREIDRLSNRIGVPGKIRPLQ
ncbi:MAG: hypothetical protein KDA80_15465 [Planctomycetaceae bacterium]|nr:hypothetical protein [Planctomycetaceae bacterium]